MIKEIAKLDNNIEYIYRQNQNTPRMALCLNFSIDKPELKPGVYSLLSRLLFQGTKNYTSEELANEFEKYAINFSTNQFMNYFQLKLVCLNEDFEKAVQLLTEIIINSTFEEFEKEVTKLKSEIPAQLDSPRVIALDKYCRAKYKNHYYGNSITKIQENLDFITKADITEAYSDILQNSKKSLAIVGALDKDTVLKLINKTLGKLPASQDNNFAIEKPVLEEACKVETIKSDLNQAHIIKGWSVPTFGEKYYPELVLLNIILGAGGLSSRLFLELRDKKGLAYVVRSSYETYKLVGNFSIYIATEPGNIETCLKGFDEEIEKIKTIEISEKELEDAKNSYIGKIAFATETNSRQAGLYAREGVLGHGFEYIEQLKAQVQKVTTKDILNCAAECFNDKYVLSIIKP